MAAVFHEFGDNNANTSIFTGTMTVEEMQGSHPLEYRRILAAHDYLQRVAVGTREAEKPVPQISQRFEIVDGEQEATE